MTGSIIAASRKTPTKNSLIPSPSTSYDLMTPHAPNLQRCKTINQTLLSKDNQSVTIPYVPKQSNNLNSAARPQRTVADKGN